VFLEEAIKIHPKLAILKPVKAYYDVLFLRLNKGYVSMRIIA
jgi:hypothetical protein